MTDYTLPTQEQVDRAIGDALHKLGYYRLGTAAYGHGDGDAHAAAVARDRMAVMLHDALPSRVTFWAHEQVTA